MQDKKIKVVTKRGFTLNAIEGDTITKAIIKNGEYDENTLNSFVSILGQIKPQTSLDVGANIGNHCLLISQHSKQTIAFEPVPLIFELLKNNIVENHLKNTIPVNKALSTITATKEIYVPRLNLGCSSLEVKVGQGVSVKIQTVLGDDYLLQNHPDAKIDFIKMDVEGHEAEALLGLENTINLHQPLLLIEWKNIHTLNMFKEQNLLKTLFSHYQFYSLTHTDNKKLYVRNLKGFLTRLYVKLFKKEWCLSNFESAKNYSNVYLVPERYNEVFNQFPYRPLANN